MRRTSRLVLTGTILVLFATTGWSAPRGGKNESAASRIWAFNIGTDPLELSVERSQGEASRQETLTVGPGQAIEVQRSTDETVRVPAQRDLLLVTAPADFDPAVIGVDTPRRGRLAGRNLERRGVAESLDAAAESSAGTRLRKGETVASTVVGAEAGSRTLRLGLRGPKSWAEVELERPDGAVLGYVAFSASRDVDVKVDLGRLLDASRYLGVVNRRISARLGEVIAYTGAAPETRGEPGRLQRVTANVTQGTSSYNYPINWQGTPPLTYTVEGGPASTCGELNVERNGSWEFTPNWLCTNGSGFAQKGPWSWSNQPDDERAQAFIRWPSGSATTTDSHIWDKRCPSIAPEPYCQGSPPTCWLGFASDPPFGACFSASWTTVSSSFAHINPTTGVPLDFWSASTGAYGSPAESVPGSLNGMPSCGVEWSSIFPDSGDHTSGQAYRWSVCITDGGCTACFQHGFTAP